MLAFGNRFRNWEDKTESRPELCCATTGGSLPLSLPPYCKAFIALLEYRAQLSEIQANRVNRSWFDAHCQLSIDSARSLSPKRLPEAVSGKLPFVFHCLDEKLFGRFWVLIRIATPLRRLVATTL